MSAARGHDQHEVRARAGGADAADEAVAAVTEPVTRLIAIIALVFSVNGVIALSVVGATDELVVWSGGIAVVNVVFASLTLVLVGRGHVARPRSRWLFELWPGALVLTGAVSILVMESSHAGSLTILAAYVVATIHARVGAVAAMVGLGSAAQLAAALSRPGEGSIVLVALVGIGLLVPVIGVSVRRGYRSSVARQLEARAAAVAHASDLEAVASTARAVDVLESGAVLRAVVGTTAELGWEHGLLCVRADDGARLVVAASSGGDVDLTAPSRPSEVVDEVLRTGAAVTRGHGASWPRRDGGEAVLGVLVGVPVTATGETVGALVGGRRDGMVRPNDLHLLELLAAQAGRALETARAFAVQRRVVDQARGLARAKDDFVATVSHELRTPLTVVLGMTETLRDRWEDADPEVRRSFLERIHRNAAGLAGIVDALMEIARAETSSTAVLGGTVDVVALVEVVAERVRPVHARHLLAVEAPNPGTTHAAGDPVLLDRVVENLVVNACVHTPEGTRVRVVVERLEQTVRVSVVDDGPGIRAEDVEHVTDRFFRGGDHLRRPTRGLGLGLAVCAELLRLHDTTLEVTSTVGRGATFAFTLARARPGIDRDPAPADEPAVVVAPSAVRTAGRPAG